jgi:HPt (histidine-containing phosphotransfer) domain-containing protein
MAEDEDFWRDPVFTKLGLIVGLDVETGLPRYGDAQSYLRVLRSFCQHSPEMLTQLDVSASDLTRYRIVVHGLKSSARGIGADSIGAMAAALEEAARAGDRQMLVTCHPGFVRETTNLIESIREALPEEPRPVLAPVSVRIDEALLGEVLEGSRHFDLEMMESGLNQLKAAEYENEEDQELVQWLDEQVENLEYFAIDERLTARRLWN